MRDPENDASLDPLETSYIKKRRKFYFGSLAESEFRR